MKNELQLPKLFPHIMIDIRVNANTYFNQPVSIGSSKQYKDILDDLESLAWGFDLPVGYDYYLDLFKVHSRTLTKEEWHKARRSYGQYYRELVIDHQLGHSQNI